MPSSLIALPSPPPASLKKRFTSEALALNGKPLTFTVVSRDEAIPSDRGTDGLPGGESQTYR